MWGLGETICDVGLEGENGGIRGQGLVVGLAKEWESRAGLVGVINGYIGLSVGLFVGELWSVGEDWKLEGLG